VPSLLVNGIRGSATADTHQVLQQPFSTFPIPLSKAATSTRRVFSASSYLAFGPEPPRWRPGDCDAMGRSLRRAKKTRPTVRVGVKKQNKMKRGIKPDLLRAPSAAGAVLHAQQCVLVSSCQGSLVAGRSAVAPFAPDKAGLCAGTASQATGARRKRRRPTTSSCACCTTRTRPSGATPAQMF